MIILQNALHIKTGILYSIIQDLQIYGSTHWNSLELMNLLLPDVARYPPHPKPQAHPLYMGPIRHENYGNNQVFQLM